jgi:serine/threonine protein kinase
MAQSGATPAPAVPVHDVPRRTTRPGGVEDRYRSLFVIGRGGMGTVEVALERGPEGFERVVALKRLLPEQARDPRHKEMFLREARLAALLQHPNVVHAFAFGELYGELFLAMEYVEGETLAHVLTTARGGAQGEGQPLDPAVVAFVLAEVCDGLHAAHELRDRGGRPLNVVHRDVSPQNVMIAHEGHVKILDFGVAKFETGGHETRTGEVKGKMAYMSPEQALGEKLDRRSDLFSVGAVLFESLTGRRMWGSGTDLEVMRRLALEEPPRLDESMKDAPRALVELHSRLVARDPASRPDTAKDVADELRLYASGWPRPDTAAVRALMQRLFSAQAQRQREKLTEALEQAAPTRVDSLRRTLDPEATFDRPTMTEPVIVESSPPSGLAASVRKQGRRGVAFVGAGALVAIALGTVVVAGRMNAKQVEPAAIAPTSVPASPPTGTTTAAVPAVSAAPRTAAPTATATTTTTTPGVTPTATGKTRSTPRPTPRPTATTKLPDVDPTPF